MQTEKKGKGVDRRAIKTIHFDDYKRILDGIEAQLRIQTKRFQSKDFEIRTRTIEKRALSFHDDKRFYINGINSLPYGHKMCKV